MTLNGLYCADVPLSYYSLTPKRHAQHKNVVKKLYIHSDGVCVKIN